ncbi:hypothetical protein CHISP_3722 [Chitinispirillum alkaliphilum]|nr:hypothetical protein CHISP_3722 [Chitinispirillum alkaliphilum]
MKFKTINSVLILTAILLLAHDTYARKSAAVLNIKSSHISAEDGIAISSYMTTELQKNPNFRILAWDDVSKILEHQSGLQLLGCEDDECIAKVGDVLGVDYIIAGDIGALGDRYLMTIRKIDINQGETVRRVSRRVIQNIGLLIDELEGMVEELMVISEPAEPKPQLTPEQRRARRKNISKWTRRVVFGSVSAGSLIGGIMINQNVANLYDQYHSIHDYNQEEFDRIKGEINSEKRLRNLMYWISGATAVGFFISIPF